MEATEKKMINTVDVTVSSIPTAAKLRLTCLGSIPLEPGAVFRVPVDVGLALCDQHASLSIEGKKAHSTPTKEVASLKFGTWEPVKGIKVDEPESATDTSKAAPTSLGKAGNKSMADKAAKA